MTKKFAAILTIMFASVSTTFAQRTTLGFRAGVDFSGIYEEYHDKYYASRLKTGFNAGFNVEIAVGSRFYVQPGLLFSTKGSIDHESTTVVRCSYIELPVNMVFKGHWGNGSLLLGAGPYLSTGIGGSYTDKISNSDFDVDFDNDINLEQLQSSTIYIKRFDAGVNILAGYEFAHHFNFQLNGQLGLTNNSPTVNAESFYRKGMNMGFGFSVGYRFP